VRLLVCLAAALALAACGSASQTSSAPAPAPTSTAVSTSTTTTTVSSTSSATQGAGGPQASAAGAGCSAHQIAVSTAPGGAGVSHVGLVLRFRNSGTAGCILTGYPGAALSSAAGHEVQARRTPSGYLGGLTGSSHPPVLHVAPGATVSALLEGLDSDVAHGGGPCPRYAHLLVTPPNQRVTIRMATPLQSICSPEIHPVVAGSTGRSG
jgi:hypothetical protein